MTEPEMLSWDDAENAIADALADVLALFGAVPDDAKYTEARNRIVMAMTELDTARDMLAAARFRMPKEDR